MKNLRQPKPKENVIKAWSAPGTNNDAIIIKGRQANNLEFKDYSAF